MEQITITGCPDPAPVSPVAARLLRERLEHAREECGAEAAEKLEAMIGERIGALLAEGKPSIDVATMRSIVDYIELPPEDDDEPTGFGKTLRGIKDRFAQRGGPSGG